MIKNIPLNKLVPSPRNVRRAAEEQADLELKADIEARGLLQNLVVTSVTKPKGSFAVEAGGRRLRALQLLAEEGKIENTHEVCCLVIEGGPAAAQEASLAENFQRLSMNPADECLAFQQLIEQGSDVEGIARRFGLTARFVEGRLRLASLAPIVFEALGAGEISLEIAKAYAATPDHERQEYVFNEMGRQFRLIVSAEDGTEYDDLRPLIRRFMRQMGDDLGTRLEWVAVDHRDTAQPHTHIILRGRDERDQNFVISREYISRGMRERLADLVTTDLGPRQDHEIERMLRRDIGAERLTATDRALLRECDAAGIVAAGHRDPFRHALRAGRLKKLEAMGLAEPVGGGSWKLADDLEQQLLRIGGRGDIIRTMQRELGAKGIERAAADRVIHGSIVPEGGLIGQVLARGLSDELTDRHYLIVDGLDGRSHHIDIGVGTAVEPLPESGIVRLEQAVVEVKSADRLIAAIAEANGGIYSADLHFRHDPRAGDAFVAAHVRRLEALRRAGRQVERLPDGSWRLGADHLQQAAAYERQRASSAPVRVEVLSPLPLERLSGHQGATWLDRELVADEPQPSRDSGFGRQVRSALALRRQWLLSQELAEEVQGEFRCRSGMLNVLRQREISAVTTQLSQELAMPFVEAETGQRIDGVVRRRVDLASGRFALIENAHEFTLVPWRPVLERHVGEEVSGIMREDGVSWTIGRGRSIGR
jgi:ParB/RepB/Spo0J family partition protein